VNALQKTLAILAFLILVSQTIRHAYLLWLDPRTSVLDKYDRPLKNEIASAGSLDDLLRRYDPVRKQVDEARQQMAKEGKTEESGVEPFKSEHALREAITEWESRAREIRELRFYWLIGLGFFILGAFFYKKTSRWLGLALLIAAFIEFIYWTSPTFFGMGTREFDRLLVNKLVLSVISFVLLIIAIRMNGIFSEKRGPATV
jgi:hypothetical protein